MDTHNQLGEWNALCVSVEVSLIWRLQIHGLLFKDIVLLNGSCCLRVNVSQLEDLK
jgi:hypothetical protein